MPEVSRIVDWMRTEFPDIKVLYAEEGQYRLGKKPDESKRVIPNIAYLNDKPIKKGNKK